MNAKIHDRIEAIAGAIALGEASDLERREYREHIACCAKCLRELGGEHEIARVASTVAAAREEETWQPDLRNAVTGRRQKRTRKIQYGAGVFALCVAVSLGIHAVVAAGFTLSNAGARKPVVIDAGVTRIVLEQNPHVAQVPQIQPGAPQRQLVVTHNVVNMQRAPLNQATSGPQPQVPREVTAITVHPKEAPLQKNGQSDRPVWEQPQPAWRTVATTTTTSQMETAPQSLTHSAESMQFAPLRRDRDAMPVGGETAINPQPPMIAYDEGAQGTAVFEVLVDDRGLPSKCVITKSTGYLALDSAVCKAAMGSKYLPEIRDGRAVAGAYRDAFTFRMEDNQSIEALPHSIK